MMTDLIEKHSEQIIGNAPSTTHYPSKFRRLGVNQMF